MSCRVFLVSLYEYMPESNPIAYNYLILFFVFSNWMFVDQPVLHTRGSKRNCFGAFMYNKTVTIIFEQNNLEEILGQVGLFSFVFLRFYCSVVKGFSFIAYSEEEIIHSRCARKQGILAVIVIRYQHLIYLFLGCHRWTGSRTLFSSPIPCLRHLAMQRLCGTTTVPVSVRTLYTHGDLCFC